MRKIIIDFYCTVLLPLSLLASAGFVASVRKFWMAERAILRDEEFLLERATDPNGDEDAERYLAEWREDKDNTKSKSKPLIQLSGGALLAFIAFAFFDDETKMFLIEQVWGVLEFAAVFALLASFATAWHYAQSRHKWKFALAILSILLATASAEHFMHQKANTERVVCPNCDDSDYDDSDNN